MSQRDISEDKKDKADKKKHKKSHKHSKSRERKHVKSPKQKSRSRSRSKDKLRKQRVSRFTTGPMNEQPQDHSSQLNPISMYNNPLLNQRQQQQQNLNKNLNINSQIEVAVQVEQKVNLNQNILERAGIKIDSNDQENKSNDMIQRMLNHNSLNITPQLAMLNPLLNTLNDPTKIKRKIQVPMGSTFNYTGLIIGPKGQNQKLLEERTGCKILVRGRGSQKEGQLPQPDDDEDQYVLIVGDAEHQVAQACAEIERILFADEETRNRIRQEQLRLVAQIKNEQASNKVVTEAGVMDASLTTPYGPPSEDAYIIPVPRDCVGLVIGKGGETIRLLQERSGARKVQVALENTEGSDMRNVFVEGNQESVEIVKQMLGEIVDNQRKMKFGLSKGQIKTELAIPINMVGLVIGKNGETVKSINARTGAFVTLSREPEHQNSNEKILLISGNEETIENAKREVLSLVENGLRHLQHKMQQQGVIPNNNQNNGAGGGGGGLGGGNYQNQQQPQQLSGQNQKYMQLPNYQQLQLKIPVSSLLGTKQNDQEDYQRDFELNQHPNYEQLKQQQQQQMQEPQQISFINHQMDNQQLMQQIQQPMTNNQFMGPPMDKMIGFQNVYMQGPGGFNYDLDAPQIEEIGGNDDDNQENHKKRRRKKDK